MMRQPVTRLIAVARKGQIACVAAAAVAGTAKANSSTFCSAHQSQQPPLLLLATSAPSTAAVSSSLSSSSPPSRALVRLALDLRRRVVRALRCLARLLRHAVVFSPVVATSPLALLLEGTNSSSSSSSSSKHKHDTRIEWWWRMLMAAVERSGPAAVKFAQWASTRQDLFPAAFCDAAARLQDGVQHGAPAAAAGWRVALEEVRGTGYALSAFDSSSSSSSSSVAAVHPIASGSVAQVYRARLRRSRQQQQQSGEEEEEEEEEGGRGEWRDVAVKVINPAVRREIELDLSLMAAGAGLLERLPLLRLKWLAPREAVGQFGQLMAQQLDCRAEAAALRQFRADFPSSKSSPDARGSNSSTNPWHVVFPEPLVATNHVLVESFEEGLSVSALTRGTYGNDDDYHDHHDHHGHGGVETAATAGATAKGREEVEQVAAFKRRVAECGLGAFLTMLFRNNLAHGDLHPGNILIRRKRRKRQRPRRDDGNDGGAGMKREAEDDVRSLAAAFAADVNDFELVFLDTGIVCRLARYDQESLVHLFKVSRFVGGHAGRQDLFCRFCPFK